MEDMLFGFDVRAGEGLNRPGQVWMGGYFFERCFLAQLIDDVFFVWEEVGVLEEVV